MTWFLSFTEPTTKNYSNVPIIEQTKNNCHLITNILLLQVSKSSELLKKLQETLAQCHYDLDETRKRAEEDVRLYIFCYFQNTFPFVSMSRQTDVMGKKFPKLFVE